MILSDVCEFIVDCPHSTAPDEGKGYPLIRTPNVGKGRLDLNGVHRVSESVYKQRIQRGAPRANDLIFAREAPAGNVALVQENQTVCLGQRTVLIRPNVQKVNPQYLVYYLLSPKPQYELLGTANGATVAHINLPAIRNLKIELPEKSVQDKIGTILVTYDDLIENNQRQIKLLEEAAQRLYKEWFVDLRFPGHENTKIVDGVPEGWEKNCAEKFFEITIGKTPPRTEKRCFTTGENGIPWVSIADMGNSGMFVLNTAENLTDDAIKQYNVKVIPKNTVLLSFKLTVGRVAIASTDICTNEAIAHFKGRRECEREYTYCYLKNFHYDELGSTSSISKAVNSKIIKAMPFIMPSEKLLKEYSSKTKDIFDLIICKQKMDNNLKIARDRILHKLMSGEVEV